MADTEKTTYLINVEDNLELYAQHAADAKIEVEKLAAENKALKESGTATAAQIEKNNASLRVAQQEYNNARKSVENATKANIANKNSYEELYRRWQLAQTQLKLMGDGYTTNAQGVRVLSEKFIQQSKVVADAKKSLDGWGKSVHDNRLNVGNYGEAIQEAFGAVSPQLAGASSAAKGFVSTITKLGPMGAVIGGSILAISAPLLAFFTKTDKGIDMLERKTAGLKAAWSVLVSDVAKGGEKIVDSLDKQEKKTSSLWKWVAAALGPSWVATGAAMDVASDAAERYTKTIQDLEDEENALIVPRAEANLKIKEARLLYEDETKSIDERMKGLEDSLRLEGEVTDREIAYQKKVVQNIKDQNEQRRITGQLNGEDEKRLAQAEAAVINLQAESVGRQMKVKKTLESARKELTKAEKDRLAEEVKNTQEALAKEVEAFKKAQEEKAKALQKFEADTEKARQELANQRYEAQLAYEENLLATREARNEYYFSLERDRLALQQAQEIKNAEETGGNVAAINDKYAAINTQLAEAEQQAKLELAAGFAGNLAAIFGQNSAIGKAAAVVETTINTYKAATAAYASMAGIPVVGPALGVAAAGAAIAAGIANVKKILAVDTNVESGSSVVPSQATAITSAPATRRIFAQPAGVSNFNQSQAPAAANAAGLEAINSAGGIAALIASMPAPVVTVEDINARVAETNKVTVRANI